VDDLVDGLWRLLHSEYPYPVNIGNPSEMTIREFAERVVELTGSRSKLTFHELPEDDPKVRQPDISKARELLDWEPKVKLEEGLERTLAWFRPRVSVED
jgi:dTDP-glucose 4,6-dehydratase